VIILVALPSFAWVARAISHLRSRWSYYKHADASSDMVNGIDVVGAGLALPDTLPDPEKGAASSAPTIRMAH